MNPDTYWLIAKILAVVIFVLGLTMYVVWRAGSEPENPGDYGC